MSDDDVIQELDLAIRHFVYKHFVIETRPPSIAEAVINKIAMTE
ncbi:MAG: hypothetical protein ACW97O_07745 [Candidatus Thorarchaeota archaeon]|jgi:hypothetical protein